MGLPNFTVAISSDFFTAFAAIPRQKQGKVIGFMTKFRNNPMSPGLNYEKINDADDPNMRSVRIDDAYRGIILKPESGNVYILLWVNHHDEAYQWARRKRCRIHPVTGSIQVYDVQDTTPREEYIDQSTSGPGIFSNLANDELIRMGVPTELLEQTKHITNGEQLQVNKELFPTEAYEALELIAEGFTAEEVINELFCLEQEDTNDINVNDFEAALETQTSKQYFYVVEGERELSEILAAPLEKWRIFLHPSQRRLVTKNFNGAARVLGGAGTGKTVVAMHRAKWLAQQPQISRILFTTFTTNLAHDIAEKLRKICTSDEMRKIEIINLDAWVSDFLRKRGYGYQIVYGDKLETIWDRALTVASPELGYDREFYIDEWYKVIKPQEVNSIEDYVKANRNGRGVRVDRKGRIAVWNVFQEMRYIMDQERVRDVETALTEARYLLQQNGEIPMYQSIIVDEAQDLSVAAYKLLRALAGSEHSNDLFVVGDAHQRIYRNKASLAQCGINIRGRSAILRLNYRTTEEIRRWATNLLQGVAFDDLDEGVDEGKGYKSLLHGPIPEVHKFASLDEEVKYVIEKLQSLEGIGIEAKDICIVVRTNRQMKLYYALLNQAGIRMYEVKRSKSEDRGMPGLRLATMHRVKGLEFEHIIIVGVNNGQVPLGSAIGNAGDRLSLEEKMTAERALLYVALTRAKKTATLTCYGQPSEFLEKGN